MGQNTSTRNYLSSRVAGAGISVFTEMSALARQYQSVNLGQGFPDFPSPAWVKQAAVDAIERDVNQYAISNGAVSLRQNIARSAGNRMGRELDAETEVTVTSGGTEAIFAAMQALVEPGDEVVMFEPFYDSYVPSVVHAGGVPRYVPLRPPDEEHTVWWFDLAELRAAFTLRTRVMLLNTPHNPTGKVFSRDELQAIGVLCREFDVVVVSDEVYEYITFGVPHISIATLPEMWPRTLTISSSGKTFSLTGWKIGWAIGPADLVRGVTGAHQFIVFCSAAPLQEGIAAGLAEAASRGYYTELQEAYQQRRDFLVAALDQAGLHPYPPEGTYFILCDIRLQASVDDVAFCRRLTIEAGVTAIPPSFFYSPQDRHLGQGLARFAFCKRAETLAEAARRLQRWRA